MAVFPPEVMLLILEEAVLVGSILTAARFCRVNKFFHQNTLKALEIAGVFESYQSTWSGKEPLIGYPRKHCREAITLISRFIFLQPFESAMTGVPCFSVFLNKILDELKPKNRFLATRIACAYCYDLHKALSSIIPISQSGLHGNCYPASPALADKLVFAILLNMSLACGNFIGQIVARGQHDTLTDTRNASFDCPLRAAIRTSNYDVVDLILDLTSESQTTCCDCLFEATDKKDVCMVRKLLRPSHLRNHGHGRSKAMIRSIWTNQSDIFVQLIRYKAFDKPNSYPSLEQLTLEAWKSNTPAIVEILLDRHGNPCSDYVLKTPDDTKGKSFWCESLGVHTDFVHAAALERKVEMLRMLLVRLVKQKKTNSNLTVELARIAFNTRQPRILQVILEVGSRPSPEQWRIMVQYANQSSTVTQCMVRLVTDAANEAKSREAPHPNDDDVAISQVKSVCYCRDCNLGDRWRNWVDGELMTNSCATQ